MQCIIRTYCSSFVRSYYSSMIKAAPFFVCKKIKIKIKNKKRNKRSIRLSSGLIQVCNRYAPLYYKIKLPFSKNKSISIPGSTHWQTNVVSITTLVVQDYLQGYILSYIYRTLRALALSRIFFPYIPPCLEKIFKFTLFTLLQNAFSSQKNWT